MLDDKQIKQKVGHARFISMTSETKQLLKEIEDVRSTEEVDMSDVDAVKEKASEMGYLLLFKYLADQEVCYIKYIFIGELTVFEHGRRRVYELSEKG